MNSFSWHFLLLFGIKARIIPNFHDFSPLNKVCIYLLVFGVRSDNVTTEDYKVLYHMLTISKLENDRITNGCHFVKQRHTTCRTTTYSFPHGSQKGPD